MRQTLDDALRLLFGDEGGYVNAKTDKGGPTKYGITHKTLAAHRGLASVTAADVKAMTIEEAEEIYRLSYWGQSGGDLLPAGLDYMNFDFGVNSGPGRANRTLQDLVGVKPDGIIGIQTVEAVRRYPGGLTKLMLDFADARMAFLRSLTNPKTGFPVNGRGWTIRVTGKDPAGKWADQPGVIGNALKLSRSEAVEPEAPAVDGSAKASAEDKGILDTLKKPEAWGPLGGLLGTVATVFAGSGPVQYALSAAIVAAIGYGIYRVVKREREA